MDRRKFLMQTGATTYMLVNGNWESEKVLFKQETGPIRVSLIFDQTGGYNAVVSTSNHQAETCIVTVFYEADAVLDISGSTHKLLLSETATSPLAGENYVMVGPFRLRSGAPRVKWIEVELVKRVGKQRFDV